MREFMTFLRRTVDFENNRVIFIDKITMSIKTQPHIGTLESMKENKKSKIYSIRLSIGRKGLKAKVQRTKMV